MSRTKGELKVPSPALVDDVQRLATAVQRTGHALAARLVNDALEDLQARARAHHQRDMLLRPRPAGD